MSEVELWRDIVGYEGIYQVSNKGRVKSLDRYFICGRGGKRFLKGRILKPKVDKDGYNTVKLSYLGKVKTKKCHRLVCQAFIPNTFNKPCVNHIDGDKTNNLVSNLEWCTVAENNIHARIHKLYTPAKGIERPEVKLTEEEVVFIRTLKGKYTHQYIADAYNVDRKTIGNILNNKSWKHLL